MDALFSTPLLTVSNITITAWQVAVFLSVIIVAIGVRWVSRFFIFLQTRRGKLRKEQGQTLAQLSSYIIYGIGLIIAFQVSGVSLSYLFVGSAALLVGIGFALQQLFQDSISGVILLLDRNINIGDVVSTSEYKGKIHSIGIRTTQLLTIDNEFIIVPNSKVLAVGLHDLAPSRGPARFRIKLSVAYGVDPTRVQKILIQCAHAHQKVEQTPEATAIIKDFGENGYIFELRFWMTEIFYNENILSEIRYTIAERFSDEGIVFAVPQRVVQLTAQK
ncbi:MAG: mechanosensitive ion channel domain-containing protein [Minisyncoccia bacterium]